MVNVNKVCNTCCKEDVCSYKKSTMLAVNDQVDIISRKNIFLKASIECEKWMRKSEMTLRMDKKSN